MTRPLYDANPDLPGTSRCRGGRPRPAPAIGSARGDLRRRSRPRSHQPRAAGVVRGVLRAGKDIAAERDSSRIRHRPQRRRGRRRLPGRRAVGRRCGQARRGQGAADGLVAPRWGDDRGRPRRRAGRGTRRRRARVRDRSRQRATLGGHLRCRRCGGPGPRRGSRAGRQSGEPDGFPRLSLAADGTHRGGVPARAVGADAGSRGVPALLHRARPRSRGPRNGRRLLGRPDLFAGAVFRRGPGRRRVRQVPTMSPRRVRDPRCSPWPGSADCRRRPGR